MPATSPFYLATAPAFFGADLEALAKAACCARPTASAASSSKSRSATTSRPPGAQQDAARRDGREPDLPHRPFPRQGDGAEHHGRCASATAIFEAVWNNRYIDHVQITAAETVDVEHARRLLRRDRRAARHGAEPSVPAAGDGRRWSRPTSSTPSDPQREGQGARCGAHRRPPARPSQTRCAAAIRRGRGRRPQGRRLSQGADVAHGQPDRDLCRR